MRSKFIYVVILSMLFLVIFSHCEKDSISSKIGPLYLIEVMPNASNVEIDSTYQFSAIGRDVNMNAIDDLTFTWTSRYPAVGTIDQNGLFTALSSGTTFLTAKSGTIESAQVTVGVYEPIVSIVVSQDSLNLDMYSSTNLNVVSYDMNDDPINGLLYNWNHSIDNIVSVDSIGLVSALSIGSTEISAFIREIESNSVLVTVHMALPSITFNEVSGITATQADFSAILNHNGGGNINDVGFCWSTEEEPTLNDNYIHGYFYSDSIVCRWDEFSTGTTYFVRAYATNDRGTAYSNTVSFTTNSVFAPEVTLDAVHDITQVTTICDGTIISDGGAYIKEHGICFSTDPSPDIYDSRYYNRGNPGSFSITIKGLEPLTNYYCRAYASNVDSTSYSNEFTFTTTEIVTGSVTDIDGNVYQTITICDQEWMAENLRTTHFRNGDSIATCQSDSGWVSDTLGAYAYPGGNVENKDIYGLLYNWNAVSDSRILAPQGWHIPTWNELSILRHNLGDDDEVGGKLKEVGTEHWHEPNTGAKNTIGFSALPAGSRRSDNGKSSNFTYGNYIICSEEKDENYMQGIMLFYTWENVSTVSAPKREGVSIRCIKD